MSGKDVEGQGDTTAFSNKASKMIKRSISVGQPLSVATPSESGGHDVSDISPSTKLTSSAPSSPTHPHHGQVEAAGRKKRRERRSSTGNIFRRKLSGISKKTNNTDSDSDIESTDVELRELLLRSEQLQTRIRALEQKASKKADWKGPLSKVPRQYQRELTDVFQKLKKLRREEEVFRFRKQIRRTTPSVLRNNELTRYVYEKQRVKAHTQIVELIHRQRKLMEVVEKSVREQQSTKGNKGQRRTTILVELDAHMGELAAIQKKVRDLTLEAAQKVGIVPDEEGYDSGASGNTIEDGHEADMPVPAKPPLVEVDQAMAKDLLQHPNVPKKTLRTRSPLGTPIASPRKRVELSPLGDSDNDSCVGDDPDDGEQSGDHTKVTEVTGKAKEVESHFE